MAGNIPKASPSVPTAVPMRFQQFLNQQNFASGRADGVLGPKTEQAILSFQKRYRLPQTGELDIPTAEKAIEIEPRLKAGPIFNIGPDQTGDIRLHRPYFAVQLERNDLPVPYLHPETPSRAAFDVPPDADPLIDPTDPEQEADDLCERIRDYVRLAENEPGDLLLTEKKIEAPQGLLAYLKSGWSSGQPDAMRLKRMAEPTIVYALENSSDLDVTLLVQALNAAIEHRELFLDTSTFAADTEAANTDLVREITHQIDANPAVRMGVATILAEPQDSGFYARLRQEQRLGADALATSLVAYLTSSRVLDLSSRMHVFVNRLLVGIAFAKFLWPIERRGPVTDVYLLSHGWHRNYYQATAAYDQLISRFTRLLDRKVLDTPKPYHPLILGVHWHSDPGQDGWVDVAGRRDKRSFLANVEQMFERPSASDEAGVPHGDRFTRFFEECFEFFGRITAADVHALSDDEMTEKAGKLSKKLDRFTLRDAAAALEHDKVAALWTCYHTALPKQVVTDQVQRPARGMSAPQAVKNLLRFIVGVVGIAAVLGLLVKSPVFDLLKSYLLLKPVAWHESLLRLVFPKVPAPDPHPWLSAFRSDLLWVPIILLILVVAALAGAVYLAVLCKRTRKLRRGLSYWAIAAWAPLEAVFFLPAFVMLFVTYFLSNRQTIQRKGIFAERTGTRNTEITEAQWQEAIQSMTEHRLFHAPARRWAAWLALQPINLYKKTLDASNPNKDLFAGVENQLAFYEMQMRGTVAGGTAGRFLFRILTEMKRDHLCEPTVRVHLIGHSFGGLVVLNAARHAALDPTCRADASTYPAVNIQSLTLLQAAVASNWIEEESKVIGNIAGTLGCAYTGYDTANGFYYPVANGGRMAAGYVGFFGLPSSQGPLPATRIPRLTLNQDGDQDYAKFDTVQDDQGLFAMLVEPPHLEEIVAELPPLETKILNLDLSRIEYEGAIPLGGGHDDIFKDDVINLIWAVTRLSTRISV